VTEKMEATSKIHFVTDEKHLNSILRSRKTNNFSVLYISLWDKWCQEMVNRALQCEETLEHPLYIVDSFELPQAFVTFSVTSAPTIIHFRKGSVSVDVEYPKIYDFFSVEETTQEA